MDLKKSSNKKGNQSNDAARFPSNINEMALAAQMGLGGFVDPAMFGGMMPPGLDPQQLLAAGAAGGMPMMDPAVLASLGALGAMPPGGGYPPGLQGNFGSPSAAGTADWKAMMQQAQLLAAIGGSIPPAFLPQMNQANPFMTLPDVNASGSSGSWPTPAPSMPKNQSSSSSAARNSASVSPAHVPKSSSPWMVNNNASTSLLAPNLVSAQPNTPSRSRKSKKQASPMSASEAVSKVISNQYEALAQKQAQTEQIMQAEIMRQFEQQFILQQLQLQQQQDQIQAAIQALNKKPSSGKMSSSQSSPKQSTSTQSDKIQQQLSQSIYQHLLNPNASASSGSAGGSVPNFSSSSADQSTLDAILALSQLSAQHPLPQSKSPRSNTSRGSNSRERSKSHGRDQPRSSKPPANKTNSSAFPPTMFPTGDQKTDALLSALYSQMQQQNNFQTNPSSADARNFTNSSPSMHDPFQSKSSKANSESRNRRKQANPTSVPNLPRNHLDSSSPLGGIQDSHRRSLQGDRQLSDQTSPLSLVKTKFESGDDRPSISRQESPLKLVKEDPKRARSGVDSPSSQQQHPRNFSWDKPHSSSSKSAASSSATNNDFLARMQGRYPPFVPGGASGSGGSGQQPSAEELKLMMAAYSEILTGAAASGLQPGGDLNAINDILTATVAAEMQRLQMEQMNLSRELDMLSNGTPAPSSSRGSGGQSKKKNRVPVIHKAQSSFGSQKNAIDNLHANRSQHQQQHQQNNYSSSECDGPRPEQAKQSGENAARKRRHVTAADQSDLKEPLSQGWIREVRFKRNDVGAITCDVTYLSPDGKTATTLDEVTQILESSNENGYGPKHFSFGRTIRIGSFYERTIEEDDSERWKKLSPPDAEQFFESIEQRENGEKRENGTTDGSDFDEPRDFRDSSTPPIGHEMTLEERCFIEAGEKAFAQAAERKMRQKDEQKELAKLLRKQQRQRRINQQKLERELRERQMLQERQKVEAARQMKYQEALEKAKEREMMRQQALVDKQQEREQRRQRLILLKNLETKRRAEERDRRREEIRNERIFMRERKLEQRRHAMRLARELKMPVEDMCIKVQQPLPKLENLQGTIASKEDSERWSQLSGDATADLLMVIEFLLTFQTAISLEESVIPTFEQLQRGLLNDPEHTGSLVQLTMALLHQCLCDPGVPAPGPWLHCATGLKVTDIDVTKKNYSEILRLFIWARNGHKTPVTDSLETEPFPSLSSDVKAEVLAFMVNELVCSQPVCAEIDRHLDKLASLRRDKWIVEGKIRQVRVEHANDGSDASSSSPIKSRNKMRQPIRDEQEVKEESRDDKESAKGDDDSNLSSNDAKGKGETVMERKMKKLTKEHQSFNEKLFSSSKPLRALDMGQDRYKRKYWVLSNLGGIYVEGLESGGWYDDELLSDEEQRAVTEERAKHQSRKYEEKDETDPGIPMETNQSQEEKEPSPEEVSSKEEEEEEVKRDAAFVTQEQEQEQNAESSYNAISDVERMDTSETSDIAASTMVTSSIVQMTSETTPALPNMEYQVAGTNSSFVQETEIEDNFQSVARKSPSREIPSSLEPTGAGFTPASQQLASSAFHIQQHDEVARSNEGADAVLPSHESNVKCTEAGEDSVLAAAKAIAAKAVASSSHILFPNQSRLPESQTGEEGLTESAQGLETAVNLVQTQDRNENSHMGNFPHAVSAVDLGITNYDDKNPELGSLTAKTLESIGVDPQKLNKTQLQALAGGPSSPAQSEMAKGISEEGDYTHVVSTTPKAVSPSAGLLQNAPIDLSRPSAPREPRATPTPPPHGAFQAALAFGGLPPGVFDGAMQYKSELGFGGNVKQECGAGFDFSIFAEAKRAQLDVYDEALPIPREAKYGWWKIGDEQQLDALHESLHSRGDREKHLGRSIAKHRKFCIEALELASKPELQFANGVPPPRPQKSDEPKAETTEGPSSEAKDEKVPSSNKKEASVVESPPIEDALESSSETAYHIEMETLKQVEELADRGVAAGILNRAWLDFPRSHTRTHLAHIPYGGASDANVKHDLTNPVPHDPLSVMHACVELLRKLEQALPRCFLKPPLIRKGGATEFSNLPSLSDSGVNDVAAGLRTWRNAVSAATSAAQLSMCVAMLESCVAWERTPMSTRSESSPKHKKRRPPSAKSSSLAPSSGGASQPKKKKSSSASRSVEQSLNEALPLDENSHGSSHRMPIDNADLLKAGTEKKREENSCGISSSGGAYESLRRTEEVDYSETSFGIDFAPGHDHAHARSDVIKSSEKKKKKKSKKKSKEKEKGEKPKPKKKSHTMFCREMLRELQAHEAAAWFLFPVDLNEVPDYKMVIKKPIDFKTIENRLRKGRYKSHEMFSAEIRSVFNNCQIFNEDESAIGRAGHLCRQFFEARWTEILKANQEPKPDEAGPAPAPTTLTPAPQPAPNSPPVEPV